MARAILGVSAHYHDSAAALLVDGRLVAAAQEERFTRVRHDASFPSRSIAYCLAEAGIAARDLERVCFYDKPVRKLFRILETHLATAPLGLPHFLRAMPVWLQHKLWTHVELEDELDLREPPLFAEHHAAHAASAFYASPFEEACVLTVDGVGEWATTTEGVGRGASLSLDRELRFPHSLGLLYSAFTAFCGFKVNSGEYKLMGLAPYGTPRFADVILRELVDVKPDGTFRLDLRYFDFLVGRRMTNERFAALFGGPAREPEAPLGERELDLAASVQQVTEEVLLRLCRAAHRRTGLRKLCLAGGVALNCVANGKILRADTGFDELFVQPAAGDAGGAVGAAWLAWHGKLGMPREVVSPDAMQGALLGPAPSEAEIEATLAGFGARWTRLDDHALHAEVARLLDDGRVVAVCRGRMEFGPRALGSRSILADARRPEMQALINTKVKEREEFRPFAPAVLAEHAGAWFDLAGDSPYMLLTADVAADKRLPLSDADAALTGLSRRDVPRSEVPAVTHVDFSARVQTVDRVRNPAFHALLSAFHARTGCPVLVNTSFNVRGEPIVCTAEDAYRCFLRAEIDHLVLGPFLLDRRDQPPLDDGDWRARIPLD